MAPRRRSKRKQKNPQNPKKGEYRNWLELPHDVTSTILLKLGAIEILESAQKVCTLWRKICKDPSMWRSIDMHNLGVLFEIPFDLEKMAMHAIDRSCGQLVDINVEYFGTQKLLKYIADRSKNLKRLRFVCCYGDISDEGVIEEAKKLPLLEELELTFCEVSREGLEALGRDCPLLKSLKLNNRGFRHPPKRDGEALAIAENMHELRHLQIFGNTLTNVGLKAILDGCPHLESLDLRQCFNVNLEENIGKLCAEKIKVLRRPNDSTYDYSFDAEICDAGSYIPDYAYDLSDFDALYVYDSSDEGDPYDFLGGSYFSYDDFTIPQFS